MKTFDFSRFVNLWSFYHPRMLKAWLITCGLLIIAYIGLVCDYKFETKAGFPIFSSLVSYSTFAAPFVFALGSRRALDIQLPATALERLVVMSLFCFIIMPLGLVIFWDILESIGHTFGLPFELQNFVNKEYYLADNVELINSPEFQNFIESFNRRKFTYTLSGLLATILPLYCGLYAACTARKSPVMSTVFGLVLGLIILAFIGGGCGVVCALTDKDVIAMMSAASYGQEGAQEGLSSFLTNMIERIMGIMAVCGIIVAAVGLPLLYRRIKKQQIV